MDIAYMQYVCQDPWVKNLAGNLRSRVQGQTAPSNVMVLN